MSTQHISGSIKYRHNHHHTKNHTWLFVEGNLWQCEICGETRTSKELNTKPNTYKIEFRTINGKDCFYLILDDGIDIYSHQVRFLWCAWNADRLRKLGFVRPGDIITEIGKRYENWKEVKTKNAQR